MKNLITPNIALALVLVAAMTAVALRAAARRPEPRRGARAGAPPVPGGGPRPPGPAGPRSAPFAGRAPGPPGRPASAVEQMQDVFHELHADGRNAACTVCDGRYWPA